MEEDLAGEGVVAGMQRRQLACQLGYLSIPGQSAQQDPAGGGRVVRRGQVLGKHTQTVGQNRAGRFAFETVAWRAAATSWPALWGAAHPL